MRVKRIISDDVQKVESKKFDSLAQEAIYIDLEDKAFRSAGSEEMRWDAVGRPIFGNALKNLGKEPNSEDTKNKTS